MIKLPDRYKTVINTLDGGGMSDTLVCRDAHLERDVVIKSLKPGVDQKRLEDELAALSAIRSKHVVQIFDVIKDEADNILAVVEEYLAGASLEEAPAPKNAEQALTLLYPIARGIKDIHDHGRIHRDIKPNNMRRDSEGCLKIYDFGLAKMSVPAGGTKSLYFTQGYSPPEALQADDKGNYAYTPAIDVYAFGITALSLLSGAPLAPDLMATPPKTNNVDFSKLPQALPPPICDLLKACLSHDPASRPKMADVERDIGRHLLFDKHRATLVLYAKPSFLSASNRTARFRFKDIATVTINYDGLAFRVTEVAGPIFINNMPVAPGFELPGACVIVMGEPAMGYKRGMLTVALSHPEVTL